ncbi:MAG: 3-deoxy-7-phosphoheptulonate synthase [Candidatus Obscuribacterales bacterium]|nr:3-deoxy-7-phosphoheptulonate synthase [Candidatus Obscuribacterales bacterium]
MIIVPRKPAGPEQLTNICESLARLGLTGQILNSSNATVISIQEDVSQFPSHVFNQIPGVEKVIRVQSQATLATADKARSIKLNNGLIIGGQTPVIMAGPCAVEGQAQIVHIAHKVKEAGAHILRGGAFKPRTSPYDFQGLGLEGLKYLSEAREATGLPVISEIMASSQVETAEPYIDILQIGARNMYNYELLKEVGASKRPILLKRGFSATLNEFLNSAEYIMAQGNTQVILCERGIRSFETQMRNTLDLASVAALKLMTALPVIVDPSHGTGRRDLVRPMSRAAIACGADGLIIEVHDNPNAAFSDGEQAITVNTLEKISKDVTSLCQVFGQDLRATPVIAQS